MAVLDNRRNRFYYFLRRRVGTRAQFLDDLGFCNCRGLVILVSRAYDMLSALFTCCKCGSEDCLLAFGYRIVGS